ncbi:MAG: lipoprotein-releasing ABC transporter permease subunit [Gammaproteobacteria bacterium]|nr:lipoprotein-releasing ABC transporter permease subunit [Gammaproteobacteria bacterium]
MIKPLSLYIGLRYTRAKRRNRFISFISLASMLGIALGVMVLITVLSVINGFDYQIRNRFFSIVPQVTVQTRTDISKAWPILRKNILKLSGVSAAAPYVMGNGVILQGNNTVGLQLIGVQPSLESTISKLQQKILLGNLSSLRPGQYHIIIGQTLADQLGVSVGDKILVLTPQLNMTLVGELPRYRRFTVSGIFHVSQGFGFDLTNAYINMQDAKALFLPGQRLSGLHVKLNDLYAASKITTELQALLPPQFLVSNWMTSYGTFFQALGMEKTILFVILVLLVAIAVFNLVSTLVMVVNDKRADIAILRTLGASPGTIMRTFIVQGAIVSIAGIILGVILGLLLASNITALTNWVQQVFQVQFLQSSVFFINFLPSKIELHDVMFICLIAFGLSLLATLYPAWTAFRTQPAEALRYE